MNKIVTLEIIGKKSYSLFRKIPLVMRLSVVFFFLSLGIAVAGNTYAQNATLSLDMSNSTIASVLEAVPTCCKKVQPTVRLPISMVNLH